MRHLATEFAPSEGRSAELEIIRGEVPPLRTATGFVVGGVIAGLFWGVVGLTAWLVI